MNIFTRLFRKKELTKSAIVAERTTIDVAPTINPSNPSDNKRWFNVNYIEIGLDYSQYPHNKKYDTRTYKAASHGDASKMFLEEYKDKLVLFRNVELDK